MPHVVWPLSVLIQTVGSRICTLWHRCQCPFHPSPPSPTASVTALCHRHHPLLSPPRRCHHPPPPPSTAAAAPRGASALLGSLALHEAAVVAAGAEMDRGSPSTAVPQRLAAARRRVPWEPTRHRQTRRGQTTWSDETWADWADSLPGIDPRWQQNGLETWRRRRVQRL